MHSVVLLLITHTFTFTLEQIPFTPKQEHFKTITDLLEVIALKRSWSVMETVPEM
jgi:hypothetical protein